MPNLTPEQISKLEPDNPIFLVMERLELVKQKMLTADPEIATHLKVIWKTMGEYEELAHLLTPAEIGELMKGLQKHAGIQLVMDDIGKTGKKKGKVSVDDLL